MHLINDHIVKTSYSYNLVDYYLIPTNPAIGILYITRSSPDFISGHVRMRGKNGGQYPYGYLEMIDNIFGTEPNCIEICSGKMDALASNCVTVDINPKLRPHIVDDGQTLRKVESDEFRRWRCDPPYNTTTAKGMYGTEVPTTGRLLRAGARVCKLGALMFLLLGPTNYQMAPKGVRRIGLIPISVVPVNEVRCLNIYQKIGKEEERIT